MEKNDHTFHYQQDFPLESGVSLPGFQLKYTTLGKLNADRSNVVWICHALTGSSDFTDWWSGLFDEGRFFDPKRYFIICANVLGGCYGSTGPLSLNPKTGKPFYHTFPSVTNRDVVQAFDLLRQELRLGVHEGRGAPQHLFLRRPRIGGADADAQRNEGRRTHKTGQFSVSRSQSVCYL